MEKPINQHSLSIVIPACNEEETIYSVIRSCLSLSPQEIIVVANGCTDKTINIANSFGSPVNVLTFGTALGNDVGRAIGAKQAKGDIILFLDADFFIPAEQLANFIKPIVLGQADVMLNDFSSLFHQQKRPHSITIWRQIINNLINRQELGIDSILSVPHAMTKEAVKKIGFQTLAFPILSHVKLAKDPDLVINSYPIDVLSRNRYRPSEHKVDAKTLSPSEKRMIGDHLYALNTLLIEPRAGFTDGGRNRMIIEAIKSDISLLDAAPGWNTIKHSHLYGGKSLSIVIPAQNEEKTIQAVIQQSRKIEPNEIIVVVNGSNDHTAEVAKANGATIIEFKERLGNDVGRSIGAKYAKGDIILFIDGDFVIPPDDLFPFAKAIADGVDVSLNDLNHYLDLRHPLNIVTSLKYGTNLSLDCKELGVGSMVAVPHGLSRKALDAIGWESLLSPVLAQTKAMLNNDLSVQSVHRVEVDKLNKIRPEEHFAKIGYSKATERIIGDHLEALHYLLAQNGNRGLFKEDGRSLNFFNDH